MSNNFKQIKEDEKVPELVKENVQKEVQKAQTVGQIFELYFNNVGRFIKEILKM